MRNVPLLAASLSIMIGACGDDGASDRDTTTATTDATSSGDSDVATEPDSSATTTEPDSSATTTEPDSTTSDPDVADTGAPDGDTSEPPPILAYERFGARIIGHPLALSRTGRTLWMGTRGNVDYMDTAEFPAVAAGLVRYDLDTGETKVFADELGIDEYDWFYGPGFFGPESTAHVHEDGARVIVVAHSGLLVIEDDSVTPLAITMPNDGPAVIPVNLEIARDGLRPVAWMTSDQGLLRLNEDDYTVESVTTAADIGMTVGDFGKLAVDPDTGKVFASFFPNWTQEQIDDYLETGEPLPPLPPTRIVSVAVTGEIEVLVPGTNALPTGRVGDLVWSAADQRIYAALGSWNASQGGVIWWTGAAPGDGQQGTLFREGQLANNDAMGTQILALDDEHRLLAVGGNASGAPLQSPKGGGLAWVQLAETPGGAAKVLSTEHKSVETPFVTTHVQALEWDPESGRLYALLSDICSETKLRNRGLYALHFDARGELRFERPLLSSVRALGEIDGDLYVGVRDDNGGIACQGYPYQSGLQRVTAGGVGEVAKLRSNSDNPIVTDPGVGRIGGTTSDALVFATRQDGFYFGSFESGFWAESPAFYGPSRESTDLLWDADTSTLWLAGTTTHSGLDVQWCEDENPETMCLADRGPRGAARIQVSAAGVGEVQRFVRASDEPKDVVGLPSGDVYDLLWDDDGSVIMACATELMYTSDWDRGEQPDFILYGEKRLGGVARVNADDSVTVLADSTVAPDARAIAWDPNHQLIVADADKGLFRLVDGAPEAIATPGLPAGAQPVTLWTNEAGDMVYGTSKGVWLSWHGATEVLDDVGWVWAVHERGDHLYLGTDEGLVVFRESTTPAAALPARATSEAIPFPVE